MLVKGATDVYGIFLNVFRSTVVDYIMMFLIYVSKSIKLITWFESHH